MHWEDRQSHKLHRRCRVQGHDAVFLENPASALLVRMDNVKLPRQLSESHGTISTYNPTPVREHLVPTPMTISKESFSSLDSTFPFPYTARWWLFSCGHLQPLRVLCRNNKGLCWQQSRRHRRSYSRAAYILTKASCYNSMHGISNDRSSGYPPACSNGYPHHEVLQHIPGQIYTVDRQILQSKQDLQAWFPGISRPWQGTQKIPRHG